MTSLFHIVPQTPLKFADEQPRDDALPLTRWRASSTAGWNDQQVQQILSDTVETIRPFAGEVAKALGARDTAAKIGAVLQSGAPTAR